jgi:hypothetical protein
MQNSLNTDSLKIMKDSVLALIDVITVSTYIQFQINNLFLDRSLLVSYIFSDAKGM